MSTNVGAIDLDLVLSSNKFNKQLGNVQKQATSAGNSLQTTFTKIGKFVAAAFSVKAIFDFGKSCIDLGSDLAEVQNVVDVAFPKMTDQVNEFANNAIEQFGLSQTVAKKYMGTFGAMSKAFGFAENEAEKMSEKLTGLAGDVASFYNMSSDEAYTKIKSVFTGETETLKELGVVMTQNALDSYAMANGYGKTTAKMSEQEKVALRYNFVLDQLSLASGDFVRTQDGWANQTRVLSLRWQEFKATIGQGLINIFTPIIRVINTLLAKLQVLADAFKSFTEMIFGNAGGSNNQSSALTDLTDTATDASDAVSGVGDSASKTKKQLLGLRGIDVLNNMTTSSSSSSSSGSSSAGSIDFGSSSLSDTISKADESLNPFLDKLKNLAEIFKNGFKIGFGDTNFEGIKTAISSISDSLKAIWTDPDVVNAASNWVKSTADYLGKLVGSIANVGVTIVENLVGGFSLYLSQNKEKIQGQLIRMFDISSRFQEIIGNWAVAFADVFSVFRSDTAKQITADLFSIFMDVFANIGNLVGTLTNDLLYIFTQPFVENKDLVKNAISGMLEPISGIIGTIKTAVENTFSKIWEVYDTYVRPAVENFKVGFSKIAETVLTVWNAYVNPVLSNLSDKFSTLWSEHLQPLVNNFLEFMGKIVNAISILWNNWISPLISWIVQNVVPVLAPIFETVGKVFMDVFGIISDVLGGIFKALGGVIDFIVGVFTGDWTKAWEGIQNIFGGIWDAISGIFSGVWNVIKDIFNGVVSYLTNAINGLRNTLTNIVVGLVNDIVGIINTVRNTITNIVVGLINGVISKFNSFKTSVVNIFNTVKDSISNVWNKIWSSIKNVANSILGGIEGMVNGVIKGLNKMIGALNKLKFDVPDWVPLIGGGTFGFNIPTLSSTVSLPRLAEGGYFKANQPTLAMIGDNKTQDEIASPVPKMQEAMRSVLQEQNKQNSNSEIVRLLKELIQILKNFGGDTVLKVEEVELARAVIRGMRVLQGKSDKPILDFI